MMYDNFFDTTASAAPSDAYPWGYMVNHMNWMVGPGIFGFSILGWTAIVLVNIVLLLLAIYLWGLIKKNSRR